MNKKEPDFPKRKPQKLKEGKCYKFMPLNKDGGAKKKMKVATKVGDTAGGPFKATVEKAYKNWYLLMTPAGYRTTMMRNAIGLDWEVKKA